MKLRLSLEMPNGQLHDVSLECDVTTTVADTASALVRSGASGDSELVSTIMSRRAPVTLLGRASVAEHELMLDPMSTIGASGLQSGWIVRPIPEFGVHSIRERVVPVAGYIDVLSGNHAGSRYSLVHGSNLIGRDRASRVFLSDQSVSRRHAVITITEGQSAGGGAVMTIHDVGSVNGVVMDKNVIRDADIIQACQVQLGDVLVQITPGTKAQEPPTLSHQVMHTRSPRVALGFPQTERELPTPPALATPSRIPILAMFAPMMMGGAMYAITQSPMSLMMVAFTPIMMIGSWADGKLGGKKKKRRERARYVESISSMRDELTELREQEIRMRAAETPTLEEVEKAIAERGNLLWTRRPEHRSFLEVRFGEGTLPSRTEIKIPSRGESSQEDWEEIRSLQEEFCEVNPVPVLERFDRCGSIGVSGKLLWAEAMARSLVLQLVGLHSPAELALACFAGERHVEHWSWLKWLPHIDAVTSPIPAWQLADDSSSATRLIIALEGLLEVRLTNARAGAAVRSHLDTDTRNDENQGEGVDKLPTTPTVIILVLDDGLIDVSRIIALAEKGPDVGIHLIWVSPKTADLPAACRTFIEMGEAQGQVNFVRNSSQVTLHNIEFVDSSVALALARSLSAVEDTSARVLDESDLPKSVNLRELHATDLLGGVHPIVQAWESSGSLTSQWRPGAERGQISLAAVIGQGAEGTATIDLRTHGPHALVGGTTGAGKSEFLQTWIMSMAARVSPDRLTFLLVDYKGGAAFAECVELPHTVGLVTDLSPHLVRRALTSLRAELHYREELLAAHGAKDLITMERRSDAAAPPVLIIVIDEFAALANEVPEFVDGVIDVAQRGRSLGLHLIMATQRPAGVIKDNLRANTNLRVALRMADEADSSDVIGVKDAAFFDAETPGRGAIKVGPGRISHFQTGYLGGRVSAGSINPHVAVRSLGFTESDDWDIPPEPRHKSRSSEGRARDIEQLRDGIVAAAAHARLATPRRPWLDALPETLTLSDLAAHAQFDGTEGIIFALSDEPSAQAQSVISIDFEDAGNIAILGAGGTGKTSALLAIAASSATRAVAFPTHIYAIDAAGGALDVISALPTVGAVAPLTDIELTTRVLQRMLDLISERGPRYAAIRAANITSYRRTPGGEREPRVILLLDGFAAFRQATETLAGMTSPFQMLGEIMMTGRSVGVHVVLTSDRASAIPAQMASSLQQQYVLRLANPHDYGHLGIKADILEDAPPGRAVIAGSTDELQIAVFGEQPDLSSQAFAIERLATALTESQSTTGLVPAPEILNAPEIIPLDELPIEEADKPVYGINTQTFAPVSMPVAGLGVISGPSGSGQSTSMLTAVEALERWADKQGAELDSVLLTPLSNGLGISGNWERVACGGEKVEALARQLVVALGGKVQSPAAGIGGGTIGGGIIGSGAIGIGTAAASAPSIAGAKPNANEAEGIIFPTPGKRGVIVVERPADWTESGVLASLVALAKTARRADVLVLFEFEQGTGSAIWDLFGALKQPNWGITLQPDDGESQSPFREPLGRVKRADFPVGRGFTIESGRVTPVHVAMPSSHAYSHA